MYNKRRDNIQYYVSLTEKGSVRMECGKITPCAEVIIPVDILFELTRSMLKSGVAQDYISPDILSDIHDYI